MLEGISPESQNLVREMRIFFYLSLLTGRQFYFSVPNFTVGHMDYYFSRLLQLPFFISSLILWSTLVLSIQSFLDITSDSSKSEETLVRTDHSIHHSEITD
jgi:hypothetical protein